MDITTDVMRVREDLTKTKGAMTVDLNNEDGKYAFPGQGELAVLSEGCCLEFSPGYITLEGQEYSGGQYFNIISFEHTSAGGKAALVIHAEDSWQALENWQAGCQFRWNKNSDDSCVGDIIKTVLAKAGLQLSVISCSATMTGFYPDFTINPGNNGRSVIQKLLSFVPDKIFIEGNIAYLINPQPGDSAAYSFGTEHVILEGKYSRRAPQTGRVQVEGWDAGADKMILIDSFNWDADDFNSRLEQVQDKNLGTVTQAGQRGVAVLRQVEMEMEDSAITVPVNCGQQLFDVVAVTDMPAGLSASNKRIAGMVLVYNPEHGDYFHRLKLGAV